MRIADFFPSCFQLERSLPSCEDVNKAHGGLCVFATSSAPSEEAALILGWVFWEGGRKDIISCNLIPAVVAVAVATAAGDKSAETVGTGHETHGCSAPSRTSVCVCVCSRLSVSAIDLIIALTCLTVPKVCAVKGPLMDVAVREITVTELRKTQKQCVCV